MCKCGTEICNYKTPMRDFGVVDLTFEAALMPHALGHRGDKDLE